MLRDIDQFFLNHGEPTKSCLLYLRTFILGFDDNITEAWKYKMPFYCYNNKMFCYLWVNKKTHYPYLGIVEGRKIDHPLLVMEKRSRMKTMTIDPNADIPADTIRLILQMAIDLYAC
jgi:hypothetical protein